MTCGNFKYLPRKTTSDKVLCNKALTIAINSKYKGYQHGLAQWFIICLTKNLWVLFHVQINLLLKVKVRQSNNQQKNYINQLLPNREN